MGFYGLVVVFFFSNRGIKQRSECAREMCAQLMLPTPMGCLCPASNPARWGEGNIQAFFIRTVRNPGFFRLSPSVDNTYRQQVLAGDGHDPCSHPRPPTAAGEPLAGSFAGDPGLLLVWSRCSPCGAQISLKGWRRWFLAGMLLENDEIIQGGKSVGPLTGIRSESKGVKDLKNEQGCLFNTALFPRDS